MDDNLSIFPEIELLNLMTGDKFNPVAFNDKVEELENAVYMKYKHYDIDFDKAKVVKERFVLTDGRKGLTEENVKKIKELILDL